MLWSQNRIANNKQGVRPPRESIRRVSFVLPAPALSSHCRSVCRPFRGPAFARNAGHGAADRAENFSGVLADTKAGLQETAVVPFGETGLRVLGRRRWLHSAGTADLTYYDWHEKRGKDGINHAGVLAGFDGTAAHDGGVVFSLRLPPCPLQRASPARLYFHLAKAGAPGLACAGIRLFGKAALSQTCRLNSYPDEKIYNFT